MGIDLSAVDWTFVGLMMALAFVTALLDQHVARTQDHSRQLWGLMSFSLWAEQVEQPGAGSRYARTEPGRTPASL